ncbi:MAG: fimbria/pilus periplasmic chaperone [Alphaproteobacteria bacterium]|nr:fimbria/pilus periplasmic chaperone [Alphaproteobacteria bacterium]MBU0797498.1 fimbria/pilus periplasmic chaperone [Alphaproteobacteria bacterium]MBU0889073.1 fimbria/pilus periplasmic chaperone [Alphaproteobacteria bacterium]MBU1813257.1 fimbria/pilus periplasmic chaperone [Alphaproteobacteria bacterium]
MLQISRLLIGLFLAALAGTGLSTSAQAELLITPKRIVLDGTTRDAMFRLVNTSSRTQVYELVWRQLRMNEQGALLEEDENVPGGVSRLVMVAPTRVTLEAGARQTVRVNPRIPEGLPDGEYMSHLTFRPVSSGQPVEGTGAAGASMRMQVRIGFSVPVILRQGPVEGAVSIQPIGIDPQAGTVTVEMRRAGAISIFGDVSVYWGQPGQDGVQVGRLDSVAIYANLTRRVSVVPLNPPEGMRIGPGLLMVRYADPETGNVLAESTVRVD